MLRLGVYPRKHIALLARARRFLADKFDPPLFDVSSGGGAAPGSAADLPRLLRMPDNVEARAARLQLMEAQSAEFEELYMLPAFYCLPDFMDLLFHPLVRGFSFAEAAALVAQHGLRLVGFEFPGIQLEAALSYQAEFPEDPHMRNPKNLVSRVLPHLCVCRSTLSNTAPYCGTTPRRICLRRSTRVSCVCWPCTFCSRARSRSEDASPTYLAEPSSPLSNERLLILSSSVLFFFFFCYLSLYFGFCCLF